uniref:Uncharacterized protein n=1 Tax=Parascaris equorum TaxID=6256 RepID=A0A914RG20_PAREQ
MRLPPTIGWLLLLPILTVAEQLVGDDEIEKYKQISQRLKTQLAEKARQTVVDIEQVIKAEESTLECLGKLLASSKKLTFNYDLSLQCKTNNIFIYYQCCQDAPDECCWHLRYWLT